ncbi:single-stranded DNA-binding protein [Sulfurospirillum sp. 1307]|jgi:single-strand DNA-binding protein
MFNKVILVGNLTRDIELRYTGGGTAVASTAIATSRKFKAHDGTQKEEVCFVDITFFGRTAEIANQYLRRGSKVLVEGRLKLDQWTDQNGGKRSKHSVTVDTLQMLGSRDDNQQNNSGYNNQSYTQPVSEQPTYAQPKETKHVMEDSIPEINIDEDEIPF